MDPLEIECSICYSQRMSIPKFYDLEAQKIIADGEKIGLFTKHPTALGAFREARLRQYLAEHTPARFAITSGFITDHDSDRDNIYDISSRQIDCLIHDATGSAPLLQTADFAIIAPEAVVAVVEVKSDLTLYKSRSGKPDALPWVDKKGPFVWAGTLVDALENIKSAIVVLEGAKIPRDSYFTGVMSYSCSSVAQIVPAMTGGELLKQLDLENIDQMPTDICVFNQSWFGISAYQWLDDPEYQPDNADPALSFLLEGARASEGSSLQLFTADFNFAITVARGVKEHRVGGLRSGVGYAGSVTSHKISLPSPRQHQHLSVDNT
ncbi:DUF6602 domain-containing protein [Steroidobacter cummioxidans]|uniref:DUF6602 domain-containing protein n=1 Tax=Steroidobacter cummioxidans TaxID=1803913 RepID=UPI0012903CBA|nr:DUF6602 domain-containing protein [Steroidobacter cummioxidans]